MQAKGVGVGCTARENTQWQLLPLLVYLTSADPLPSRLGVNSSGDTVSSGAGLRRVSTGMANGALVLIVSVFYIIRVSTANSKGDPLKHVSFASAVFAAARFPVQMVCPLAPSRLVLALQP